MSRFLSTDQTVAGVPVRLRLVKTASRTAVAGVPFAVFDQAGNPGAGSLTLSGQTNGQKQTSGMTGYPSITCPSDMLQLRRIEFGNSVPCRMELFDIIVKHGPIPYTAGTTTPTGQPTITERCPDYSAGTPTVFGGENEIWVEVSTAFVTGTAWQIQVTYTNSAGVTGRTSIISAAQAAAALTIGKRFPLALQAGDFGVQKIESIIVTNGGTAMTAGVVNVMIVRPIYTKMRVPVANGGDVHDWGKTGLVIVPPTAALDCFVSADSTATGLPELLIELAYQ